MRSLVEGFLAASRNNRHHDPLQIAKHITSGEANGDETSLGQFPIADHIMRNLIR